MPAKGLSNYLLDRYGDFVGNHIGDSPDGARVWLDLAYNADRVKLRLFPDRNNLPYQRRAAKIAVDSVSDALNDLSNAVISSIFLPNEVFLALGAKPASAEAISGFSTGAHAESGFVTQAEGAGIPETYCSFHKVLMGMAVSGVLTPPRMLASCSVACDANNLTFKALARRWHIPYTYVDVPYETDDDSVAYVADQLRDMAQVAQDAFGRTLDEEELKARVAASQRSLAAVKRSLPLRRGKFMRSDMGNDMQIALATHIDMGLDSTAEMCKQMVHDIEGADDFDGISLVWAHVPPFFLKPIADQLAQNPELQVVASDMLFDQVTPDGPRFGADQPYEAMAERLVRNCFNGPATRRADTLLRMARETGADGAVVFCHWGCKETAGAAQLIRSRLEAAGYPTLVLDGDACDRGNCMEGQMTTRFGAFVEMLQAAREQGDEAVAPQKEAVNG